MAVLVEDSAIDLRHLVVVRYVDFRTGYREAIREVVKFSMNGESPDVTRNIRLATPADFRESGYEPGIADDLDAALRADLAPYMARYLSRKGSHVAATDISVAGVMTSQQEPWLYCTSLAPTSSYGATSLRNVFAESKGSNSAVTAIASPALFARRLGIEIALSIESGTDIEDSYAKLPFHLKIAGLVCGLDALPSVDLVIWVDHGPVHYEDRELVIETDRDMPTMEALRACFTKRTEFSPQREYRFALSVSGRSMWKAIYLQASGELLRLTRRID